MKQLLLKNIKVFVLLALVAISFYLTVRIVSFSFQEAGFFQNFLSLLLIVAESFVLLHSFGYMLEVLKVSGKPQAKITDFKFTKKNAPTVTIVLAARHEPRSIIYQTLTTLNNIDYPNKKIFFIDDSSEEKFIKEADQLSKEFAVEVFRREERHGAKAGAINDLLPKLNSDYIAFFDADQNPMPNFLSATVPILEKDKKIGFVQTPQFYSNVKAGPITRGAAMQQSIFYENICEGKHENHAMFCCGTNVVFRTSILKEVGGFDENSITEDFATSLKIHLKGYKSVYYNHVSSFGAGPETLSAYFRQQTRWASGTIGVFTRVITEFFKNPFRLKPLQWWEYFLSGSYYFMGWVFFILMICPISYLLFDVPTYFLLPQVYISAFVPYYVLAVALFYTTMSARHYSLRDVYYGSIMGNLSFPILMKAAVYGILNKKMTFEVTQKGARETLPLVKLWPYVVMLTLNLFAIGFGIGKFFNGVNQYAVAINILWASYHIFILSNVFILNRRPNTTALEF